MPTPNPITKRACTSCHYAKRKCKYSSPLIKSCDRCIRQNRECIPYVSRQGKRPKKKNAQKKIAEGDVGCASGDVASSEGVSKDNAGEDGQSIKAAVDGGKRGSHESNKVQGSSLPDQHASRQVNEQVEPAVRRIEKHLEVPAESGEAQLKEPPELLCKEVTNASGGQLKWQEEQLELLQLLQEQSPTEADICDEGSLTRLASSKVGEEQALSRIMQRSPSLDSTGWESFIKECNIPSLGGTSKGAISDARKTNPTSTSNPFSQSNNLTLHTQDVPRIYDTAAASGNPTSASNQFSQSNDLTLPTHDMPGKGPQSVFEAAAAAGNLAGTSIPFSQSNNLTFPTQDLPRIYDNAASMFESAAASGNPTSVSNPFSQNNSFTLATQVLPRIHDTGSVFESAAITANSIGTPNPFSENNYFTWTIKDLNLSTNLKGPFKSDGPVFESVMNTENSTGERESLTLATENTMMEFDRPINGGDASVLDSAAAMPNSFKISGNSASTNEDPVRKVVDSFSSSINSTSSVFEPSAMTNQARDRVSSTPGPISLTQWTKCALDFIDEVNEKGIASTPYLMAALKIALLLTKQIHNATDDERLALLDVGSCWGDCVGIWLETYNNDSSNINFQEQEGHNDNATDGWLDGLLSLDDNDNSTAAAPTEDPGVNKNAAGNLQASEAASHAQIYNEFSRLVSADGGEKQPSFSNAKNSGFYNYLKIESAEIRRPRDQRIFTLNREWTKKDDAQQIFYLGLLFYQLFSGGEKPSPTLHSLTSVDGAFFSLPRLSLEKSEEEEVSTGDAKRQQGPSGSKRDVSLCQVSCEYLNFVGVPGPLCNLIFNMLDCIHGDLSGNECYTNMEDIASDLQLMIDEPSKFLRNLDTNKLSLTGLQIDEFVIPRDEEFNSIISCYRRCNLGSQVAVITGESGSGKTWLAHRIGSKIIEEGGVFWAAKFDQMRQTIPFGALSLAFSQYCDVLLIDKEMDWARRVTNQVRVALGRDACYLIQVIPKLGLVLDDKSTPNDFVLVQNSRNALLRLHYLFCQFVEAITFASNAPVALFLDDVQWIDEASLSVLHQILRRDHRGLFFLGCFRTDNTETEGHRFWKMINDFTTVGINATTVEMGCIGEDVVNRVISEGLCLLPRLVKSLSSIIHKKTMGNVLFISQLILSLSRTGLIHLDLDRKRWMWNEHRILSMKMPENVAICFINIIGSLDLDVQLALYTLSMFGASAKADLMYSLESQLNMKLIDPLQDAVGQGLVNHLNGSFTFCHDRIQESCYNMIAEEERRRNHIMYGQVLAKLSQETNDDSLMYIAVNQINCGGPSSVQNAEDFFIMAHHNLICGKKAMSVSEFATAYSLLCHGIAFLREDHWDNQYSFSLEIHELAAKSALATGKIEAVSNFSDQIMRHARSFEDKLNTYFIIISSLVCTSKIGEALETGLSILSQLGEDLPRNPSEEEFNNQISHITREVSGHDPLKCQPMTDISKIAVMKLLGQLQIITMFANPILHPFVIFKMMRMTISYGLSPTSPTGFAYFASFLAKQGDIRLGKVYSNLAKDILQKLDAKEVAGEVLCVAAEVQCYTEPLLAANELRVQGESAAISAGDVHFACLNRLQYCYCIFSAGVKLGTVMEKISNACLFMKIHENKTTLAFLMIIQRTVWMLLGCDCETLMIGEDWKNTLEIKTPRHLMHLAFQELYLSFLLNIADLKDRCQTFFEVLKSNSPVLVFTDVTREFYAGLAAYQIYRETRTSLWRDRGRKCMLDIQHWGEQGSMQSFQHNKMQLLLAEDHYCNGNLEDAKQSYKNAIESAQYHKFINEEALSCELAAKFYLATSDLTTSLEYFIRAHQKYQEWGAVEKANRLFAFVNSTFTHVFGANRQSNERDATINELTLVHLRS